MQQGFQDLIEQTIYQVEGVGYIEKWIKKRDESSERRVKTEQPPCLECKQPIYEDQLRDYKGDDGRKKALQDILDDQKTKFAILIAEELSKLEKDKFPPKMVEFFMNINKVV